VQGIPLILETPTSECPAVWKEEIKLLNSLSASAGPGPHGELDINGLLEPVRAQIKVAGGSKKGGAGKTKKTAGSGKSGKRKVRDEDEDEDEGTE
jgi:hypothetical protein